ncbi:hypothetical protein J5N97_028924 [Dioscorea zingiberensis]|uniref:Methyltransferase n=1 Tax=Dioscorea zingiberensis TaxID=325984 RepID=A0A9D5BZD4_9LILI|nr:hypothetical protein J5N97_028924 [Dioscorea zingiberensis]
MLSWRCRRAFCIEISGSLIRCVNASDRYVNLKACITRLPENGYGVKITPWPARLHDPPDRLQDVQMDAYVSKKELFKAELRYWNDIIEGYVRVFHLDKMELWNVMDMRAGFGGFAVALNDLHIDCWVMNVGVTFSGQVASSAPAPPVEAVKVHYF